MAIPASCILWHKMESAGNSEKGVNPTSVGTPVFTTGAAGKFGEAHTQGTSDYLNFEGAIPANSDVGTIEFWFKSNGASTGYWFSQVFVDPALGDMPLLQGLWYAGWSANIHWTFDLGGTGQWYEGVDFGAGEWHHFAFTWDASLSGGEPRKLYWDGVKLDIALHAGNLNTGFTTSAVDAALAFQSSMGTVDNLKIFDYVKTDFSDRFDEGFGPARRRFSPVHGN